MKKERKKDIGDLLGIGGGTIAVGGLATGEPMIIASGAMLTGGTMGAMILDEYLKERKAKRKNKTKKP